MLYIWPYILFFSFPLLHHHFLHQIIPAAWLPKFFRTPYAKQALPRLIIAVPIITAMLATVHFNTLIHPFTLADNRHYMFYIFRVLLRHPYIKYLATPIYFSSAWATITALGAPSDPLKTQEPGATKAKARNKQATSSAQEAAAQGPRVSFVLVWLLATALSLITAPLVEPRYFILPWLIWRLHLPSLQPVLQEHSGWKNSNRKARSLQARVKAVLYREYDYRLWVETVWLLVVDWATGYVFLYWGFGWAQEPGRVQRFMW